jgi:hypothetical protein
MQLLLPSCKQVLRGKILQVDNARTLGWSWQDIATWLGVTKQWLVLPVWPWTGHDHERGSWACWRRRKSRSVALAVRARASS